MKNKSLDNIKEKLSTSHRLRESAYDDEYYCSNESDFFNQNDNSDILEITEEEEKFEEDGLEGEEGVE
jgi:hypothetical protein